MPGFKVYGDPVPQGSMECLGPQGKGGRHLIVDSKRKVLDPWRDKIAAGATAVRNQKLGGGQLVGPVALSVTFTLERPKSVPLAKRAWPIVKLAGDLDKHVRSVCDALTIAQLIIDDSQVVQIEAWCCYPDTPGCPDRMNRPGALIRIETIE